MQSARNAVSQAFIVNFWVDDWLYAGQLHVVLQADNMHKNRMIIRIILYSFMFVIALSEKITEKKHKNCRIYSELNKNCIFI